MRKIFIALSLLAGPMLAQVQINLSRQMNSLVQAQIGKKPTDIWVYKASVINLGTSPTTLYPSRIAFEVAKIAPVQDSDATIYAAQHTKAGHWWVPVLDAFAAAAKISPYAGTAVLVLQGFGVSIPSKYTIPSSMVTGIAAGAQSLKTKKTELKVPDQWLREDLDMVTLEPGKPKNFLLALGGNPELTFQVTIDGDSGTTKILILPDSTITAPEAPHTFSSPEIPNTVIQFLESTPAGKIILTQRQALIKEQ